MAKAEQGQQQLRSSRPDFHIIPDSFWSSADSSAQSKLENMPGFIKGEFQEEEDAKSRVLRNQQEAMAWTSSMIFVSLIGIALPFASIFSGPINEWATTTGREHVASFSSYMSGLHQAINDQQPLLSGNVLVLLVVVVTALVVNEIMLFVVTLSKTDSSNFFLANVFKSLVRLVAELRHHREEESLPESSPDNILLQEPNPAPLAATQPEDVSFSESLSQLHLCLRNQRNFDENEEPTLSDDEEMEAFICEGIREELERVDKVLEAKGIQEVDWRIIWSKLHRIKGDVMTLGSNKTTSAIAANISSLRGSKAPAHFDEVWEHTRKLIVKAAGEP